MRQFRGLVYVYLPLSIMLSYPCGTTPLLEIIYRIQVQTGYKLYAGTDANVFLEIYGSEGNTGELHLNESENNFSTLFERGNRDIFKLKATDIGDIEKIKIGHDNTHRSAAWLLDEVVIDVPSVDMQYGFSVRKWLEKEKGEKLAMVEVDTSWKRDLRIVYNLQVKTGVKAYAATDANVYLQIFGSKGSTGELHLKQSENHAGTDMFEKGGTDIFKLKATDTGEIEKIKIGHDGTNQHSAWYLEEVTVDIPSRGMHYRFIFARWLDIGNGEGHVMAEGKWNLKEDSRILYKVQVKTGTKQYAGTDANVYLQMFGSVGYTEELHLNQSENHVGIDMFEKGQTDVFELKAANTQKIEKIKIGHDGRNRSSRWFLEEVIVQNSILGLEYGFSIKRWLEKGKGQRLAVFEGEPSWVKHIE